MTNASTGSERLRFEGSVSDIATLLRPHPLFAEIDFEALTKLIGRGQMLVLRPGDVLIRHGEVSDAAYIVVEGWATICIDTSYGAVHLSTVSAPTLVGEIGVFIHGRPAYRDDRGGDAVERRAGRRQIA
jgi:CRP-like cAMP-binding protein